MQFVNSVTKPPSISSHLPEFLYTLLLRFVNLFFLKFYYLTCTQYVSLVLANITFTKIRIAKSRQQFMRLALKYDIVSRTISRGITLKLMTLMSACLYITITIAYNFSNYQFKAYYGRARCTVPQSDRVIMPLNRQS